MASRTPSAQSSGTRPWSWGPSIGQTGLQTAPTSCMPVPSSLPRSPPSLCLLHLTFCLSLCACPSVSASLFSSLYSLPLFLIPTFPWSLHVFSVSLLAISFPFIRVCLPLCPCPSFAFAPRASPGRLHLPSSPTSCAFANTPKYSQVLGLGGRIVRKEWVLDCHRMRRRLPSRR